VQSPRIVYDPLLALGSNYRLVQGETILSSAESTSSGEQQPPVVLVVEDDISVRWPLTEYLRQTGWAVIETSDAAQAMEVISSGATVDIVFADFRLPGGPTGYMLAQWLANVRPTIPVLLTSGLTSRAPGFVEGPLRAYIAKPYAFSEVSRMLTELSRPVGRVKEAAGNARLHRVLVVDDDIDSAASLSLLLQLGGHTTAIARDGMAALEVAGDIKPNVVLLDLGLPGIDGYEVAREIRRRPELGNPFLVAVTGWNAADLRLRTQQAGFDEHLTKPVDISMLELLMRNIPERRGGTPDPAISNDHSIDISQE
jgi:CheY-like chemotaxis protein